MLDRQSQYQTLRSPLSPLSDKQIDMSREDFSVGPPSYDQAQAMDPIDPENGCDREEEIMCLFVRGWASGMQREAEVNLIKAEALLTEIFPNINNLNRLQQRDDQDSSKDDQDKQSIFSRLSRSSKMSRKVSTSCSRQRLRMLIAADKISISSFLGQARGAVKHQKGYISRASRSAFTPQEAEKWLSDAIATGPDPYALQYIGARQVRYLSEPKKKGYTLLCQTKAYKNTMRAQEARLLRIEKTMQTLK